MRFLCTVGLVASCLSPFAVRAQATLTPPAAPTANPAPSGELPKDPNSDVARGLFMAGKAAYEAGNYNDAMAFFQQSYERSGRPQLLFNIGQAADRLRQDDKALEALRAYRDQVPTAPNRGEVEARIAALERAAAERKARESALVPSPAQTAAQAQPLATSDSGLTRDEESAPVTGKWWFWTGVGAVVLGAAAVAIVAFSASGDAGHEPAYQGNAGSLKGP